MDPTGGSARERTAMTQVTERPELTPGEVVGWQDAWSSIDRSIIDLAMEQVAHLTVSISIVPSGKYIGFYDRSGYLLLKVNYGYIEKSGNAPFGPWMWPLSTFRFQSKPGDFVR